MDFQAFIFCGRGAKLTPFSNVRGDTGVPKALLPVANRSMIEFVLDWCEQAQFKEVNLVIDASDADELEESLKKYREVRGHYFGLLSQSVGSNHAHYLKKPSPINIIPSKCENTGECLKNELLDKITGDFVLLPCDFITDIPPQVFLDQYLNKDPENLAMAVYYHNGFENIDKKHLKQFLTVYSENLESVSKPVLLDVYSKDDVDKTKYLQIRSQMLWRYPNSSVSTKLLNSFIYFCSHELVNLLKDETEKGAGELDSDSEAVDSLATSFQNTSFLKGKKKLIKDPINCNKSLGKLFRDLSRRSWQHVKPRETIGIFVLPEIGLFIRSNSLSAYMESNRYVLKIKQTAIQQRTTDGSSAIGADSMVGNNCAILEKTNIKRSVLGDNCKVGKRCRIVGCVVLDNVEIDDETQLENVIIGRNAKIGKKSKLTNCYVEGSYIVNEKSTLKGETLTSIYIDDEDYASSLLDSDSSGSESDYTDEYYDDEDYVDDGLFDR
ncbi:translation initiation factor eIF2B subunit gamma [Kluyveromyces lactis]|uniref:Translation initiation factor eIF2B subunit gamma n=1 Tax=Kluyveromyces lactis (strain ATCC 8585 / CBS 2359 / DSM 70799 / NBRC 1267 / NRRL Y-1140 / WM37) TaxID=284590 RepID=Q6CTW5_KLULA|nr:uncharacterized protein KLLA0_C09570g [Kluyveromyces lactis]CAH01475.1 KLLA0C09570p [Kluyveromyces lactis]|eukprot:XP_452624.1 uncharacterized protein KLLA0_C09570g [Kluyveromyces lactis]